MNAWRWIGGALTSGLLLTAACGSDASNPSGAAGSAGTLGSAGSAGNAGSSGEAGAPDDRSSRVVSNGYLTTGPWSGSGFTATDPGAATITPNCGGAACVPPFTGNSFCMQGTVTGRADYTGFAMLGWNLSQPMGGTAATWPVPDSGGVTVTVSSLPPSVALRVQLQGTDPHSGADRWCAALSNGVLMPWSEFKTNCWQGGSPQDALTPGTPLQQGAIIVPGLLTDLPFDVCLIDVEITP
jgi:hypothetical protein